MEVPLLTLTAQNQALESELKTAFERVLRSGHYILGPEQAAFEHQLATYLGVRHAIGVSSGTDAILLALMALQIGPGDEVICPSFTFFATAGCVARLGAKPVFVDSCPACFNLDAAAVARRITPRTKAIIPVHLFGQAADMDAVMALAREHRLAVIEDGAQSLGASYRGRKVGGIGTFGTFSFFPSKNLGGFGDAGLLVTNDDALAEKARVLRVHGAQPKYYHSMIGGNFRMDPLQAALLAVKLPHYETYNQRRRANAAFYTARLREVPGVMVANTGEACGRASAGGAAPSVPERLILPAIHPGNDSIWNQYTVRVPGNGRRDALRQHLAARQIGSEVYYPVPLHRQACFAAMTGAAEDCPTAVMLAGECLSLPVFPELASEQMEFVVSTLTRFLDTP